MSVLYLTEKFGGLLWMGESPLCLHGFVFNYTSSIYGGGEEEEPRGVAG